MDFRRPAFFLASLLAASAAATMLAGCGGEKDDARATTPVKTADFVQLSDKSIQSLNLQYCQAADRTLDMTVKTTGEVLANANLLTHVNSPVTGRVTEVLVRIGEHVTDGQPLCRLRSNDIEQAEADLLQNEAQVRAELKQNLLQIDSDMETARAQVKLSESTYNRLKGLVEEQIASRADFEAAKTTFEKDKISLSALGRKRQATIALSDERMKLLCEPIKQKLRILGVSESSINEVLRTRQVDAEVPVLSPESGIVSERLINVGELADPSRPLFTIGNFDSVWIKADVYEKDVAKVQEGQPIVLEVDSFPGEEFRGKLNYVADSISPDTRTLNVRAEVDNPGCKLKPKMFARMSILVGEHRILTIPKTAVQDAGYAKVVYVPRGRGGFVERRVELGNEIGDYVEVLKGLTPGDTVVTNGSFELRSQIVKQET
jgi:multidrug efflux pump subunit AcrA (membrane-fusion protein)